MYTVLIVDSEPLARNHIRRLLQGETDMVVVGEYSDGITAAHSANGLSPDLVIMDVELPEMDGWSVLRELGEKSYPAVVFVTALKNYACQAFEVHAVDYLLKPVDRVRFQRALHWARKRLREERADILPAQIHEFMQSLGHSNSYIQRLAARRGNRIILNNGVELSLSRKYREDSTRRMGVDL